MRNFFNLAMIIMIAAPCAGAMNDLYVSVNAGLSRHGDMEIPVFLPSVPESVFQVRTEAGNGLELTFAGGFKLMEFLRLEGEIGYWLDDIEKVVLLPEDLVGLGAELGEGNISSLAIMGNIWYDMDMESSWQPYFGGGLGMARVSLEEFTLVTYPVIPDPPKTEWLVADDSAWQPAFQVGAGMGFRLRDNTVLSAGYRFFATTDPGFADASGNEFEVNNSSHNFEFGLRFFF